MKYSIYLTGLFISAVSLFAAAQEKKAMTFEEMVGWQRISESQISDDGKWVTCKMEPWKGDGTVFLYDSRGEEKAKYSPVSKGEFSSSSKYLLITKTPSMALEDSLKLKKTDSKKMPMNSLVIRDVKGQESTIDSLRNYKLSQTSDFIAYKRGSEKDSSLYITSLDRLRRDSFANVSDYGFAKKSDMLYYVSDSILYTYTAEGKSFAVSSSKGVYKQIAFSDDGTKLAYLYAAEKDSASKRSTLFLSENNSKGIEIASYGNKAFPENWVISENGNVYFSENNERLFFGTANTPRDKDTTILAENFPDVQVWTWNEGVQYTQQNFNKAADLKRSYLAVYNIAAKSIYQLANENLPSIQLSDRGNGSIAILSTEKPYATERMWTGKSRSDVYTVNLENGAISPLFENFSYRVSFSPEGKYIYWYADADSSWFSHSMVANTTYRLTTPQTFDAWNMENDVPDFPKPYGVAGWTDNDEAILISDRFDIWKFSPTASTAPVNITVDGRQKTIQYTLMQLDKEKRSFNLDETQYLRGFNETSKGNGYYSSTLSKGLSPKKLIAGDFRVAGLTKAKNSSNVLYTKETYSEYPDLRLSDLSFKKSVQLTHGVDQQKDILWGTAELTSWISLDGTPLEGVIYKPANFDPNKKYPMIVNFYERNATSLYNYHMPSPGRSTIDYPFYISQGFIIFNPDVRYTTGYPGESCYNCVMPGITAILEKGYVDKKAIGAQGHSWGGYQVAYLATRTNLFSAIESGAPVVNMLSAYGGIRWGSGLNRSFQYEHGQSRIGGSIWERPLQYIENSPLFNMDKVTTPILIMHNDADGHVPWYQGIEYFVALRRLQKPSWLLNYVGEPHWPSKMANRIDFQKRMFQFFHHYLQGAEMPEWMKEGIPAVDKDFELGY